MMTITDEEIRVGLRQCVESYEAETRGSAMQPSSLIRKDLLVPDLEGIQDKQRDIGIFIASTCDILIRDVREMIPRVFFVGYSRDVNLSSMLSQVTSGKSPIDLTDQQREVITQELEKIADDRGVWDPAERDVVHAQAALFFMAGRRFRQFVSDSITISEILKEAEVDEPSE